MESSFDAKIRAAATRELPCDPSAAYESLLRVGEYDAWWPRSIRFEAGASRAAPGGLFVMRAFGGRFGLEVAKLEKDRAILLRFVSGPYAGACEWLLEPSAAGTQTTYRLRAEPVTRWLKLLSNLFDLGRVHSLWADAALEKLASRLRVGR
jgi:hypothetical protein